MPSPVAVKVGLTDAERDQLLAWARRPKSAQALALRSRIVLAAAEGLGNTQVAQRLGVRRGTVMKWRARFAAARAGRAAGRAAAGAAADGRPMSRSRRSSPRRWRARRANATHWSTRSMAAELGLSQSAVSRIWRAFGLQPHRQDSWKLSRDPYSSRRSAMSSGLYLNPPERAVVLCVDEKSQIQALDRTAPVFPMMPGVPARATHDYKRAGTSNLYAALDMATGQVIGSLHSRHRAIEFKPVPGHHRQGRPRRASRTRRPGQRLHPQDTRDQPLAGRPSPFPLAFHPDQLIVAQPGPR